MKFRLLRTTRIFTLLIYTFTPMALCLEDVVDSTMTPEAIVDAAVQRHVSLLCITDHNSDDNSRRSIKFASAKHAGQCLVLAGVEITTSNGHLLAYFDPDDADSVQTLLARLELIGRPGARDTHTKKSMADVIVEAERLHGLCIAAHIDRTKTGFEMLANGYPNWESDIVTSSGLYELEFDDPANILWFAQEDSCPNNRAERKKLLERRSKLSPTAARTRLAPIQKLGLTFASLIHRSFQSAATLPLQNGYAFF